MKPVKNKISDLYVEVAGFIILIICFLEIGRYIFVINANILPKYIYLISSVFVMPIIVFNGKQFISYSFQGPPLLYIAIAGLNLLHWLFYILNDAGYELINIPLTRAQYLLMAVLFGFVISKLTNSTKKFAIITSFSIVIILQIFDYVKPGFIVPQGAISVVAGRAGSIFINSTIAGEAVIILSILTVFSVNKYLRGPVLILSFAAVFITFSRAALLSWIAMALMCVLRKNVLPRSGYILGIISIPVFMLSYSFIAQEILPQYTSFEQENIYNRMNFFTSSWHGDDSSQERIYAAERSMVAFWDHPVIGSGAGYTDVWSDLQVSSHNENLLFLAEYGLIGYAIFLALLWIIFKRSKILFGQINTDFRLIFFQSIILFSFFTHNMFDDLNWLIAFIMITNDYFQFPDIVALDKKSVA